MRGFRNSVFADEDLIESFVYGLTERGEEQALKYKGLLDEGRKKICNDPYLIGSKSQERLAKGCRSYRVEHCYFFYRVNEEENVIEIARVLQETRNFPEHVASDHFPNS